MSGEKIQLDEWDLSDPLDRYLLASNMSRSHAWRLRVAFVATVTVASVIAHATAGLYFQSDVLWYFTRFAFDVSRVPPLIGTLALFPFLWYAWVQYDAPSEEHIRSLYSAAEQSEAVYGEPDDDDASDSLADRARSAFAPLLYAVVAPVAVEFLTRVQFAAEANIFTAIQHGRAITAWDALGVPVYAAVATPTNTPLLVEIYTRCPGLGCEWARTVLAFYALSTVAVTLAVWWRLRTEE